jgi:hypothetical protein
MTIQFSLRISALAILLSGALTAPLRAAAPFLESLKDCKLPTGVVLLPLQGTLEAHDGYIFHFADGKFATLPHADPPKTLTSAEMVDILRADKSADLMYFASKNGTLWAVSGKIQDLGAKYLCDAAAARLDLPAEIPAGAKTPAGTITEIAEGRTYLLECTDGRYALIRPLQKTTVGLQIQFVYQPDGSLNFDLPKPADGGLAEVTPIEPLTSLSATRPAAATPAPAPTPADPQPARNSSSISGKSLRMGPQDTPNSSTVLEPFLSSHLRQREALIKTRIAIVQAEARTPIELQRKTEAIDELAALRATEATDVLIAQINFLNPRIKTKEFSSDVFHPCVGALKKLGKPASLAALKALRDLKLDALDVAIDADGTQSAQYRAGLLALVVRGVEGNEVADFLLKKDLDSADDAHKIIYRQILGASH